jgi:lipid A 4'-phosphatase
MIRTGLALSLAIGIIAGALFAIFPEWDLALSRYFIAEGGFALQRVALLKFLRDALYLIIIVCIALPAWAVLIKLVAPGRPLLIRGTVLVYVIASAVLGPVLLTNTVLKDNWGRPRPRDVVEFGGSQPFLPWWDPRGHCPKNCSFIAGEPAGAFWTFAPASLAPPHLRPVAYAAVLLFGATVGVLRMSFGGHFFSDVVFAGVLMYLVVWLVHGFVFRWRATRFSDAAVERVLARIARPFGRGSPGRGD